MNTTCAGHNYVIGDLEVTKKTTTNNNSKKKKKKKQKKEKPKQKNKKQKQNKTKTKTNNNNNKKQTNDFNTQSISKVRATVICRPLLWVKSIFECHQVDLYRLGLRVTSNAMSPEN